MSWWTAGLAAVLVCYVLVVAAVIWGALRQAKRADEAAEEMMRNLSDTGERVDPPPLHSPKGVDRSLDSRSSRPERAYRLFEDFDFESAWQRHSVAWESEYEAGRR